MMGKKRMLTWTVLVVLLLTAALLVGCAERQQGGIQPLPAGGDAAPDAGQPVPEAADQSPPGEGASSEQSAEQPQSGEQPAGQAQETAGAADEPVPAPPQVKEFRIEAFRFGFEPSRIEVDTGDVVRIIATSRDGTHGFALPQYRVNLALTKGTEQVAEFVADTSGEFTFTCSIPCGSGHSEMKGTLVVR